MIGLILTIALVGVLLYAVEQYVPMAPPIKLILRVVVVLVLVTWLLRIFGVPDFPIPHYGPTR